MKQLSGAAKQKRRKDEHKLVDSWRGSIHKFLKSNTDTLRNPDEFALLVFVGEQSNVNLEDTTHKEDNVEINAEDTNVSDREHVFNFSPTESASVDEEPVHVDIYDPTNWAFVRRGFFPYGFST